MKEQVFSAARVGTQIVTVVAEVSKTHASLPRFSLIGLPQKEVQESRLRIFSALRQSGIHLPHANVTVNLQPVDLPKTESALDLAIALVLLQVHRLIPVQSYAAVGELGLDGSIRIPKGVYGYLGFLLQEHKKIWLPPLQLPSEIEEKHHSQIEFVTSLQDVIAICQNKKKGKHQAKPLYFSKKTTILPTNYSRGLLRALEICLAGNHHTLLIGSPGLGKTHTKTIVQELMPTLSPLQAWQRQQTLLSQSWEANEQRISVAENALTAFQLLGNNKKLGLLSQTHFGLLFLDELPAFRPTVLQILRKILETNSDHDSLFHQDWFPHFVALATCNPCPCSMRGTKECHCTLQEVQKYFQKISNPLWDRFDITWRVGKEDLQIMSVADWEDSRERIRRARKIQEERASQGSHFPLFAGQYRWEHIRSITFSQKSKSESENLEKSWRKTIQNARLACTIADLQGEQIDTSHLELARFFQMEMS